MASFCGHLYWLGESERYKVFYDGTIQNTFYWSNDRPQTPGDGHVVAGKMLKDYDGFYTSLELDELVLFNRALEGREIQAP